MERLTSEQIRLLEELRELRDAGILTVEEFEFQVAKVLGRPLVVEPIPFVEEPLAPQEPDETAAAENPDEAQQVEQSDVADVALVPDTSHESELLEYELVEPDISDEDEILVEENQVAEPPSTSYTSALPIVEPETQQNVPSRRKVLIGTTAGLVLIAVIGFVALVGGGKSDSTSTQIIDNTTTVTQSTMAANTDMPTTSTQFVDNTTTVPQNASIGTANQPKITTPATTPVTTPVSNPVSGDCIVTDLRTSKSHSVLYYPSDPSHAVTFTATVLNDEKTGPYYGGSACDILLVFNRTTTDWLVGGTMKRVQPGTWTFTWNIGWIGPLDFCVLSKSGTLCNGPSVSLKVLDAVPPDIGVEAMSPGSGQGGDTVSISVIIRSATGVDTSRSGIRLTAGSLKGQCGVLSLSSGNERDGVWTADCVVPVRPPETDDFEATVNIVVWGNYSDSSTLEYPFEVL